MNVERDLTKRWEAGTPHHPKSQQIMRGLERIDWTYNSDFFCWKTGGDGDNGEQLMYELDVFFEEEDEKDKQNPFRRSDSFIKYTAHLRDAHGEFDREKMAIAFRIKPELVTPDNIEYFGAVYLLHGIEYKKPVVGTADDRFYKWLDNPNDMLGGHPPAVLIEVGKVQVVAEHVLDLLTGAPT